MNLRTLTIYAVIYAGAGTLLGGVLSVCGGVDRTRGTQHSRAATPVDTSLKHRSSARLEPVSSPACTQAIYTALSLLWRAESSYGKQMVGDGGRARGHFQHHRSAWAYGTKQLGVDWPYSDADDLARAAAVTAACWSGQARQAVERGEVETLIRRHRLPNAPMRPDNDIYLERVMR